MIPGLTPPERIPRDPKAHYLSKARKRVLTDPLHAKIAKEIGMEWPPQRVSAPSASGTAETGSVRSEDGAE